MKQIRIKRATTHGLVDATGVLIEKLGHQFCAAYSNNGTAVYLIELHTGSSALCYETTPNELNEAAIKLSKMLDTKTKEEVDNAIVRFVEGSKHLDWLKFPVNKPVRQ